MIPKKVTKHLESLKIKYKPVVHKTVFTAYDAAATMGAKLGEIAKSIHIVADKKNIIVVLPASSRLDLVKLKKIFKAKKIEIAKEKLMTKIFDIKKGTLVPFAALHKDVDVLVERALTRAKRVVASAGTFEDSLDMKAKDFLKAVGGKLADFAQKRQKK